MKEPGATAKVCHAFMALDVQAFDLLSHELLVFLCLGYDVEAHLKVSLAKQIFLPILGLVSEGVPWCPSPLGIPQMDGSRC